MRGLAALAVRYRSPIRLGLSVIGAVALAWILVHPEGRGTDAYSYWSFDPADPYRDAFSNVDAAVAFRYAPPVALALLPFQLVSFATFLWTWTALAIAALGWVCRGWTLATLALYPVLLEVSVGNIHILLAAAIVLGFRFPESWALVILTKVTTGVGICWFAFRAEWRLLARALAAVAVVAAVTYPFAPGWWADWIRMLQSNVGLSGSTSVAVPLALRFPVAVVIVAWGARTDRRWTVPVASFLALPTIWPQSFAMLVALVPLAARPAKAAAGVPNLTPAPVD